MLNNNAGPLLKNNGNLLTDSVKTGHQNLMDQCKVEAAVDVVSLLVFL